MLDNTKIMGLPPLRLSIQARLALICFKWALCFFLGLNQHYSDYPNRATIETKTKTKKIVVVEDQTNFQIERSESKEKTEESFLGDWLSDGKCRLCLTVQRNMFWTLNQKVNHFERNVFEKNNLIVEQSNCLPIPMRPLMRK